MHERRANSSGDSLKQSTSLQRTGAPSVLMESEPGPGFRLAHDLFRKPVPIFRDHALADDLLERRLSNKGRSRKPARRGGRIDLLDKRLVERNVDSNRTIRIDEQRNRDRHRPCFDRFSYIPVPQNIVHAARLRQPAASTFKRFRMPTKRRRRICDRLFQSIARREASFHIRAPDPEGTVGFLFDDGHVMRRHRPGTLLHDHRETSLRDRWSRPPSGQFVDPADKPRRQIPSRVRYGDNHFPFRMLERAAITAHSIKNPPILLQHPDQLAAVAFHRPFRSIRASSSRFSCSRSGPIRPTPRRSFVCKYIHTARTQRP